MTAPVIGEITTGWLLVGTLVCNGWSNFLARPSKDKFALSVTMVMCLPLQTSDRKIVDCHIVSIHSLFSPTSHPHSDHIENSIDCTVTFQIFSLTDCCQDDVCREPGDGAPGPGPQAQDPLCQDDPGQQLWSPHLLLLHGGDYVCKCHFYYVISCLKLNITIKSENENVQVLFYRVMRYSVSEPKNPSNDR